MSLDLTPVHRNLHTKVTFLGLEFEDLILVLALAALMNLLAHFVSGNAHVFGTHLIKAAITVGEPNWTPLELVLPACELESFMYMGRAGEIELYKHWLTRRYLNISANGRRFYCYSDGTYVEVTKAVALDQVRDRDH